MRIYAFYVDAKRSDSDDRPTGLFIRLNNTSEEALKSIEKHVDLQDKIEKGSTRIISKGSMTLTSFAEQLKPNIEDLVKQAKIKESILKLLKDLPIN